MVIYWACLFLGMAQALSEDRGLSESMAMDDMLLHWTALCNTSQAFLDDCEERKPAYILQLWGERHSGTNMMQHVLKTNFRNQGGLYPFGFKHMFLGEENESIWNESFAAAKKLKGNHIVISRSLYDWTDALKNEKDYQDNMPDEANREMTLKEFVTQPWRCMKGEDFCFDNVLELRKHKFKSLIANLGDINVERNDEEDILLRDAGRAIFVRYEDLSSDYGISVACRIVNSLKLCPTDDHFHPVVQMIKPGYRMGTQVLSSDSDEKRVKNRDMWKAEDALDTLNDVVDWDVENYMGYRKLTRSTPSDDKGT